MSFAIKVNQMLKYNKMIASTGRDLERNKITLATNYMLEVKDDKTAHIRSVDNTTTCLADLTFKTANAKIIAGQIPIADSKLFANYLKSFSDNNDPKKEPVVRITFVAEGNEEADNPHEQQPHVRVENVYNKIDYGVIPVMEDIEIESHEMAKPSYTKIDFEGIDSDGYPKFLEADITLNTRMKFNSAKIKSILADADFTQAATYPIELVTYKKKFGIMISVIGFAGSRSKFFIALEAEEPFEDSGRALGYGFDNFLGVISGNFDIFISKEEVPSVFKKQEKLFTLFYMISFVDADAQVQELDSDEDILVTDDEDDEDDTEITADSSQESSNEDDNLEIDEEFDEDDLDISVDEDDDNSELEADDNTESDEDDEENFDIDENVPDNPESENSEAEVDLDEDDEDLLIIDDD